MDIQIGKIYNYFDDGKIRESRRMSVKITAIIPFDEIDSETLSLWKEDVEQCDWLYHEETDFFVKGDVKINKGLEKPIVFVRTLDGGWFSLGFWGGRLDVDGSLMKSIKQSLY